MRVEYKAKRFHVVSKVIRVLNITRKSIRQSRCGIIKNKLSDGLNDTQYIDMKESVRYSSVKEKPRLHRASDHAGLCCGLQI